MYEISFRDMHGNIVKEKKFNTKQERDEYYWDRVMGEPTPILLNEKWYERRYNRVLGKEYIIGVSILRGENET